MSAQPAYDGSERRLEERPRVEEQGPIERILQKLAVVRRLICEAPPRSLGGPGEVHGGLKA